MIWAAPAFVTQHLLIRRHVDRRHQQLKEHLAAQGTPSIETEA